MLFVEGHNNSWLHIIGEIGAFLSAAIASHFIYDRLIRKDEQTFLLEEIESSIEKKMANFEKQSGIIGSENKWNNEAFINELNSAKNRIRILSTWIGQLATIETPIKKAIQRGIRVDILLLNPTSTFSIERAKELRIQNSDFVKKEIDSNLERLSQFAAEASYPGTFDVRLYEGHPILLIQVVDDIMRVSFFLRDRNSLEAPVLTLRTSKEEELYFSNDIDNHFESIWLSAKSIDFKDSDWRNKI